MTLRYWWWHANTQESITARILPTLCSLLQFSSQNNTAEISKKQEHCPVEIFLQQTIHQGQQSCDCKKSMGWFCQWLNWWQSKPCSRGQKGVVSLSCPLWSTAARPCRASPVAPCPSWTPPASSPGSPCTQPQRGYHNTKSPLCYNTKSHCCYNTKSLPLL